MTDKTMQEKIKANVLEVDPDAEVWLYGSRARGDYHEGSDWDLLLLIDKPVMKLKCSEREDLVFPFTDMGWDIGEDISARAYTKKQWQEGPHSMFYFNVEEDKKLLYES